jgi:hypothetical protein
VTPEIGIGLVLAVISAGALNWGFFVQHGSASTLPPLEPRHPVRSLRILFATRRWLVGFAVGVSGWAFYVAALALAPLSLVQATSAGGIGLLALLVSRVGGVRLRRREWIGVGAALVGLALLGISLAGRSGASTSSSWLPAALWMGASLAAAGLSAGPLARFLSAGAGLGVASGMLYAAGDVGTKAAIGGGRMLLFVPALLACHGLGFVALQLGFQRGGVLATAGTSTLLTNALPIAAGMTIFREGVPAGALGLARIVAFAAVVVGAVLLTTEPGAIQEPERQPLEQRRPRPSVASRPTTAETLGR